MRTKEGQTWQVLNNLVVGATPKAAKPKEGAILAGNIGGLERLLSPGNLHLAKGSPAIDACEPIPEDWPDPLRSKDAGKPDAGAFPLGAGPLKVGRFGRIEY